MNILCYGDSNTYGYNPEDGMRYPEEIRWPGRLRKMLDEGDRLIEEGCNGRTAAFTPAAESWKDGRLYLKACLNSHKPLDLVILMLGSNDLKKEFQARPEQIAGGIREMLTVIGEFMQEKQGFRPEVLLIAPPLIGENIVGSPFADRFEADAADRSRSFAELYAAEAERAEKTVLPRCAFLDAASVVQPSEIDSLHLMPESHAALAEAVAEKIREMSTAGRPDC